MFPLFFNSSKYVDMLSAWKFPERKLYAKKTTPDNWVPSDFLQKLQKNAHIQFFDFWTIVQCSGLIFQQLCCICLFTSSFIFLLWNWVSISQVAALLITSTILSSVLWWLSLSSKDRSFATLSTPLHTGIVILVFSSALAPVLHSLLDTVSTDTIYAMTFLFLLVNWISSPYANGVMHDCFESNTISMATGFLASLCLASRLPGPIETLILILFATQIFASWPCITHRLQSLGGGRVRMIFTLGLGALALVSLWPFLVSKEILPIYQRLIITAVILAVLVINLILPWLLFRLQSMKYSINGPWDEAILTL